MAEAMKVRTAWPLNASSDRVLMGSILVLFELTSNTCPFCRLA